MRKRILITIVVSSLLGACAHPAVDSTPANQQGHDFNRRQVEYVYQALLLRNQRAKWLAKYAGVAAQPAPSDGVYATAVGTTAGLVADTRAGVNPWSTRGVNTAAPVQTGVAAGVMAVSAAISIANSISNGGPATRYISQLLITKDEVSENKITDAVGASAFARKAFSAAMDRFAQETGRRAQCVHNCEGRFPTFELRRTDGHSGTPGSFDPDVFYITFGIAMVVKPRLDDPVLDRILGYTPALAVRFLPCISEEKLVFDDSDLRKFIRANPSAFKRTFEQQPMCRDGLQSPLEFHFMRTLTAEAKVTRGSAFDKTIALAGRLYHMDGVMADDFIDYEILPPPQ